MRNPYIVGVWVRGHRHYGRERLIDHLLHSPVDAVWVIGNRRMGKTSLLRQLEYLTLTDDTYIPLFWDMQGCTTLDDLSAELVHSIEDVPERFEPLRVKAKDLHGLSVPEVLRILRRQASYAGRKVLLLSDEVEALIPAGENDPQGLRALRAALQRGDGLRVIITSTKILSRLNDLCRDWETSPFLFGFGLRNLVSLSPQAAEALIRQTQSEHPVEAAPELVQEIRQHTNDHPYLIQYLCQRLFDGERGCLRPIVPSDLLPDVMLSSLFEIDFRHLCAGERAILRQIAEQEMVDEAGLQRATGMDLPRLRNFLYGLTRLGYLREQDGGWAAHNSFFASWLQANRDQLMEMPPSGVSDQTTQDMLVLGQEQEMDYLQEQLKIHKRNLGQLEVQRARYGLDVPLHLTHQIEYIQSEIARITQELNKLKAMRA